MTGPEHYREAERLVARAHSSRTESDRTIALAQVHATLALVAVSAHTGSYEAARAWAEAIS